MQHKNDDSGDMIEGEKKNIYVYLGVCLTVCVQYVCGWMYVLYMFAYIQYTVVHAHTHISIQTDR